MYNCQFFIKTNKYHLSSFRWLIGFMSNQGGESSEPFWKGTALCVVIFICMIIQSMLRGVQRPLDIKIYTRMYSALIAAVYQKVCL